MNRVKKALHFIREQWPLELSVSIFLTITAFLLLVNLRTLVGGYSSAEQEVELVTNSFPSFIDNLVYWPYYMMVYITRFVVNDAVLAARLVSVGLGFIATFNILLIIKRWFSTEIAIVGATIFVAGSWFLQIARTGTPEILGIATILTIFASVLWLINRPSKVLPSVVVFFAVIFGIFVPFLPILMIAGFVLAILKEKELLRIVPLWLWIILTTTTLAIVGLFAYSFTVDFSTPATLLALPSDIPTIGEVLQNFRSTLAAIFWYAPSNPGRWLANLPLLDILGVVMLTLGVYHHERNFGNRRSIILFGSSGLLVLLITVNGGINATGFSLLLPMVGLFIISGVWEFLSLWRRVFPFNPIAKALAVLVISVLVSVSSFYQLNRYFIAWANTPATRAVYSANIEP